MNMHDHETQIIGAFLNNHSLEFAEMLSEDHFYSCRKTYSAIKSALNKKIAINYMDIAKECDNEYKAAELHAMMIMAMPETFESCFALIKEIRAEQLFKNILRTVPSDDVQRDVTDMMARLQGIDFYRDSQCRELKEFFMPFTEQLDEWEHHKDKRMLIGITKLDDALGGLHRGELTVVGARTSVGKSHFALQTALNVSKIKMKVLFVSVEMSGEQMYQRAVIRYSEVSSDKMRSGTLQREDWSKIVEASAIIEDVSFPLSMRMRTIQEIRSRVVFDRPDLLIIDYVGKVLQSLVQYCFGVII